MEVEQAGRVPDPGGVETVGPLPPRLRGKASLRGGSRQSGTQAGFEPMDGVVE